MKEHEFTLVLTADPTEDEADEMYGTFDDGTIASIFRLHALIHSCDSIRGKYGA